MGRTAQTREESVKAVICRMERETLRLRHGAETCYAQSWWETEVHKVGKVTQDSYLFS